MSEYAYYGAKIDILCNCGNWFRDHKGQKYCGKCKSGGNDPLIGVDKYRPQLRVKVREMEAREER